MNAPARERWPACLCAIVWVVLSPCLFSSFGQDDAAKPPPTTQRIAHDYIVAANQAYATSLRRAARAIRNGGKIGDAQVRADQEYSAASRKEFAKRLGPGFQAILPEGTEPMDDDDRRAYARHLEHIAEGVEEVK